MCAAITGSGCPARTTAPAARSPPRSPRPSRTGLPIGDAVKDAQEYTWQTLKAAFRPGMGQHIPDRLFWAREEEEAAEDRSAREE